MEHYNEGAESLIVIVIDTNPALWAKRSSSSSSLIELNGFMEHIMIFANSFLMLKHQNQIAIIANHLGESKFLFPKGSKKRKESEAESSIISHTEFAKVK